jgi:uncharacterized surface protein with fasciclin (FAS1) repeats
MRSGNWSIRSAGAVGAIAGAVALTVAACGSSPASPSHHPMMSHHPMTSHHPMASHHPMVSAAFGSDCGMIPATGMGSVHAMSMDTFVTAASHNPLLTAFAADVKTAGLASDLGSMHAITVFAPANSALSHLSASAMGMMHGQAELAKFVKYAVVDGRVTPAEFASGMTLKTLEGGTLKASKMGAVYEVNSADVICGNIQTANATVYIINKALFPMH